MKLLYILLSSTIILSHHLSAMDTNKTSPGYPKISTAALLATTQKALLKKNLCMVCNTSCLSQSTLAFPCQKHKARIHNECLFQLKKNQPDLIKPYLDNEVDCPICDKNNTQ